MNVTYRGMDRDTLGAAYNNGAAVKDSEAWLAGWTERSKPVRARERAQLDIAYGPAPRAKLDYLPSGQPNAPLFAFIHGGYWQRNHKDMFAFAAEGPLAHGIDVAVIGYTLAPEARLTQIVREIDAALAFLAQNAARFGFDADAIYAGGWSAGGHLTAMACHRPMVRGGLAISGLFELEPVALIYVNDKLRLDRDEVAALSPQRHLRKGLPPLRLAMGGDELSEMQRQSVAFKEHADALGVPVSLKVLPGHHHYSIMDELAKPDGALTAELLALVG